ncbi:HAD family hydrolase [Alkalihalobacillus alcalophilus ATCC 27647 = CGMCC 1.3604]|uniref:Acid sugar phosphatase n=1 Tax=Alkalihalobacillus alcalophilus ATCC 27647 = CGMCC 1.3604 TaxID=1218173 RepID=A0A094WFQ5_ALKAL|nr:TIGR01457 family HAD-type hydrolase [Alkalihalobacillus alcalophilus]KGA95601.1 HAD family hydrolase [Alkalihalobacillus alcalophilus ATCC 27647 = CGMCC 1.3604]MED1564018.1 TIGR01457 family HAD-type hydrolase [Alkalihalobacillus alcalophilus]THG91674.1 HAD family hydrolase [Alkalihalobacillus alcalophilus ATCC 27647 = CGMCC 1.3604]
MKKYQGFLIDLDGTIYRGKEKIDEAIQFVKELEKRGLSYLFVTNNSTKPPREVAELLQAMDVPATTEHVFTTSMATAKFLSEKQKEANVYVIGEVGLRQALVEEGHRLVEEDADFVVMGLDREITYEKLARATIEIRKGATFIATNGDVALPTERGLMPGCGSLVSVVAVSTGIEPTFIGKPESIIVEQAMDVLGLKKEETLMVGDNYETDILAGIQAGIDTLIVHTGVTSEQQLQEKAEQPTMALKSLAEWSFGK